MPPSAIDIRNCNPVQLYSVKSDVVWVQCTFNDGLFEVVELRNKGSVTDVMWTRHSSQNIAVFSSDISRNGLVLVKEKDGKDVTFLYYGSGSRLERKGLKELSALGYSKPSLLCKTIEELFFVNDELILLQCILRSVITESGLVMFNTSNPSQSLTVFHHFQTNSMKVHVFEGFVVLLADDTLIIRNAVNNTGIEQLVVLPAELGDQGVFIKSKDTTYFVCTSQKDVYFVDILRVLAGNITAYQRIKSIHKICINVNCSPMQYIYPLLFIP